jgi:diguanylate cyclase (GGDEF)-like protein
MTTAGTAGKSTILVVEDEVGIARMVQVLLEAKGFATLVSHSGEEALRRLEEASPDLILLDVMMPGMDGYEVCRRIKAEPRWRHTPVVMLTAKDTTRDMVHGLEIGADDYITKPFNTEELIARIKVLLRVRGMSLEVVRRNRELHALNAVAQAVNRSLSVSAILDGALAGVVETLSLAAGLIHLIEPNGAFRLRAACGVAGPLEAQLAMLPADTEWIRDALAQDGASLAVDASKPEALRQLAGDPPQPLALIPLAFQDRDLGVFTLVGQRRQQFSQEDATLFTSIGRQVSVALENSRLYTETQRKAQEFEALYQVSRAMASTLDLQNILTRISETVSGLLDAQAMSLMLLGADGRTLSTAAGVNLFEEDGPLAGAQRAGGNPSLVAVREKRPVAVSDLGAEDQYGDWLARVSQRGFQAFVAVPLIVQDRALGCMNLYMTDRHEFGPEEIQLLSTFASQAAVSIENARLFEETRQLAITDPLTGLANHRQFYTQLTREMRRAQRYRRPLAVLMLDLDHFKAFNDRFGHLAGDQALREIAGVLRQNARSVDILARYGGEEFAIILPETDLARAATQAERVRSSVAEHVFHSPETGHAHRVTVSIGAAMLMPGTRKAEDLVGLADQALYRAKAGGRNRLELAPAVRAPAASD